jgi:hypothetical protein
VEGLCKKRLSQKSHVDEKRSGRHSILRKVKKMVISKSLHKKGRSTRKLASKLNIQGPQSPKTPSKDIWDLFFGACSCKRPVLRKISRNQMANDFSFPRSDRSGQFKDLRMIIFNDEGPMYMPVPRTCKNVRFGAKKRSKMEPIQKSKFAPKFMV